MVGAARSSSSSSFSQPSTEIFLRVLIGLSRGTDDVLGVDKPNLTFAAKLVLATQTTTPLAVEILHTSIQNIGMKESHLIPVNAIGSRGSQRKPLRQWLSPQSFWHSLRACQQPSRYTEGWKAPGCSGVGNSKGPKSNCSSRGGATGSTLL